MPDKSFNFAIVRSMFGSIWIGKTKLPANNTSIFTDYDTALEEAKHHASYDDVVEMELAEMNDEIEEIMKSIERFIV